MQKWMLISIWPVLRVVNAPRQSEHTRLTLQWEQGVLVMVNYNVHCSLDAVMDSIRNYDTSGTENDTDTVCSASDTRLQLPVNQVRSVYLLTVSKNNFHACRHAAQRFTTMWAFSVVEKDLFLYISLFPALNKNLSLQRSCQNKKNSTFYVLYNGLHLKHWNMRLSLDYSSKTASKSL